MTAKRDLVILRDARAVGRSPPGGLRVVARVRGAGDDERTPGGRVGPGRGGGAPSGRRRRYRAGEAGGFLEQVLKHGDTVSSVAQVQTARSLGFNVEFHMDGSQSDIEELLLKNIPVPIGVLHRGHIDNPSGGGHWVCIIGMTDTHFFVHDPFGKMDLINGGYIATGPEDGFAQKYSKENLMKGGTIDNDSDGWYVELKE